MKMKSLEERESEQKENTEATPSRASKKCIICEVIDSKYKCPQCFIKYCSVKCYKTHRESCIKVPLQDSLKPDTNTCSEFNSKSENNCVREKIDEDTEDRVPVDLLLNLEKSPQILTMLDNPHLRAIMENLCNSEDSDKDVAMAMQEPIFTEFADECLKIVDVDST